MLGVIEGAWLGCALYIWWVFYTRFDRYAPRPWGLLALVQCIGGFCLGLLGPLLLVPALLYWMIRRALGLRY